MDGQIRRCLLRRQNARFDQSHGIVRRHVLDTQLLRRHLGQVGHAKSQADAQRIGAGEAIERQQRLLGNGNLPGDEGQRVAWLHQVGSVVALAGKGNGPGDDGRLAVECQAVCRRRGGGSRRDFAGRAGNDGAAVHHRRGQHQHRHVHGCSAAKIGAEVSDCPAVGEQ